MSNLQDKIVEQTGIHHQAMLHQREASWYVLLTLHFKDEVSVHWQIWHSWAHYFSKADDYMI